MVPCKNYFFKKQGHRFGYFVGTLCVFRGAEGFRADLTATDVETKPVSLKKNIHCSSNKYRGMCGSETKKIALDRRSFTITRRYTDRGKNVYKLVKMIFDRMQLVLKNVELSRIR